MSKLHSSSSSDNHASNLDSTLSASDDVMKVLADVESQLHHLRSAQKTQEKTLTSLSERSKSLRQSEEHLAAATQELALQQHALEKDREQLAAQQHQLQTQRSQAQEQLAQKQSELGELRAQFDHDAAASKSLLDSIHQQQTELDRTKKNWEQQRKVVETQFTKRQMELDCRADDITRQQNEFESERLRILALSEQCQQERAAFAQRSQEMEADRAELMQRVEQAERNVGELIAQVEKSSKELSVKTKKLKDATAEAANLRVREQDLEKTLHETTQRANEVEKDFTDRLRDAEAERKDLGKKLKAAEKNLHALQAQVSQQSEHLADSQKKMELAGKKLTEFAQILSEQTPQLERGAAAIAMVDQQNEQIERLTKQLAEQNLRSDPEEMKRRDVRITELTEALRQARGQSGGQQGIAELEQRNAELGSQVDRLKLEAENAQLAADEARRQLKNRVEGEVVQTMQDASSAEHAARIAALTAQIEQLQAAAAVDLQAKLEAQSLRHQQDIEQHGKVEADAMQTLHKRIAQLEGDLRAAHSSAESLSTQSNSEAVMSSKLRERAERVNAVAEHLRRRRVRLAKLRSFMQQRQVSSSSSSATASMEVKAEELIKIENERMQLLEVRRMLAGAEQRMIRRWAAPRAAVTIAGIVLLAIVSCAVSWLAADHLFPAQHSASVMLSAKSNSHSTLTPEEVDSWRTWHTEIIRDDSFLKTAAQRMAERRLDSLAEPSKLAQRINADLTMDADQDGLLMLTLAGTDPDELTAVLDVIASTLLTESNRQMSKRGDNVWAVPTSERRGEGRIQYASLNAVPISDERLSYALPICGGLFAVLFVLILATYKQLSKAKRVFDEENGQLFSNSM